jgi:hypothetical protein
MANENVIISRQQQRRGLKQNLPQPLRAGEIGFTTDSRQVYIGSDTDDVSSAIYNKSSIYETTLNAKVITSSIANTNMIFFSVPHKRYVAGSFDGVATAASWNLTDDQYVGAPNPVFSTVITNTPTDSTTTTTTSNVYINLNVGDAYITVGDIVTGTGVSGTVAVAAVNSATNITLSTAQSISSGTVLTFTPNNILNLMTNESFKSQDITVAQNGVRILGATSSSVPTASTDFGFNASTLGSNTHTLNFRVAPLITDEVDITYYSDTAMIQALSADDTIFGGSTTRSFYAENDIPSYRQLNEDLISVSYTTGTGIIGLEFKHLAVTADGTSITTPGAVTLGNLLCSRDSEALTGDAITATGANLSIEVGSGYPYSNTSFDWVFIEDAGVQWITDKALAIDSYGATDINVTIPTGNTWTTDRAVSAAAAVANIVTITGDVEGLTTSHSVIFTGANAAYFDDGAAYSVLSVGTTSFTVNEGNATVAIANGLNYINYGTDAAGGNVQIISAIHGNPLASNIDITTSTVPGEIAVQEYVIVEGVTTNTMFIGTTSPVTDTITGTSNVVIDDSVTVSNTPVRSINLSGDTTVTQAIATVAAVVDWPSLIAVPDVSNKVYFSHKPAYDSVGVDFHLHEDTAGTLATLGLASGEYNKSTSTVKAKLERWINTLIDDKDINLFLTASATTKYSTYGVSNLGTYTLNIDTVNDEILFDSREEARDFNTTVNTIYNDRPNASSRGLVNLKTNIEMLTGESAAALSATSTYGAPSEVTIPGGVTPLTSIVGATVTDYNVHIIDYSIIDNSIVANVNYMRVGSMHIAAHDEGFSGNVILMDTGSETLDSGATGNVTFSASIGASNEIVITATNTLNTSSLDCTMRFISRRWIAD